jgi:gluconolactonase
VAHSAQNVHSKLQMRASALSAGSAVSQRSHASRISSTPVRYPPMPERSWEILATDRGLAEAPCIDEAGDVWFSDVLLGGVHRWSVGTGEVTVVVPDRKGIGGMARHADGGMLVSGRDVRHVGVGEQRVLLAAAEGVTGFNDLTVDRSGRVVVGALRWRPFAGDEPVASDLWRIGPGGGVAVIDDVEWPNGLGFSPEGDRLYVDDYAHGHLLAYAVDEAGVLHDRRVLAVTPSDEADGLAVDETGAIHVALGRGGGIGRYRPDGTLDGVLDVPGEFVSSLCFGGGDGRDLVVTCADRVLLTRADVAGLPIPAATI